MKKYISILMVFVMLIAIAPMAYAEETTTTTIGVTRTDKKYSIGQTVDFSVSIKNSAGDPIEGATATVTYKLGEGAETQVTGTSISTSALTAGTYTLKAAYAGVAGQYSASEGTDTFTLIAPQTITIGTCSGGTVTSDKSTAMIDEQVTLTVTPESGHVVKTLTGSYTGGTVTMTRVSDTSYTFIMPAEQVTVSLVCEEIQYEITAYATPSAAGTATASPTTVTAGGTSNITASEETDSLFYFYKWSQDKGTLDPETSRNAILTVPSTVPTETEKNINVQALYISGSVVSNDTNMGTVEIKKNSATKSYDITATPKTGYKFTQWVLTSGNGTFGSDKTANTTFTLTNEDSEAKAVFESLPSHTLTVKAGTGGTVTPTSATSIKEGLTATITATPSTGYVFSNWTVTGSGGVASSTSASTTYTMGTADATVTANFSKQNYTVYAGKYTGGAYGKAYVSYDNGSTWIEITTTSGTTLGTFASGTVLYFKMVPYTNYYSHPYVYSNTSGSYYAPTIYNYIFNVTVTDNITVKLNFTTTPPTGDTSVWQYVVAALASTGVGTGTVVALKRKKK